MNTTTTHNNGTSKGKFTGSRPTVPKAVGQHRWGRWLDTDIPSAPKATRLLTQTERPGVFLPAAGNRWDGELNNAGSYGYYWSRSLNTDSPNCAWCLTFHSVYCRMSYYRRNYGSSVRPVREK